MRSLASYAPIELCLWSLVGTNLSGGGCKNAKQRCNVHLPGQDFSRIVTTVEGNVLKAERYLCGWLR